MAMCTSFLNHRHSKNCEFLLNLAGTCFSNGGGKEGRMRRLRAAIVDHSRSQPCDLAPASYHRHSANCQYLADLQHIAQFTAETRNMTPNNSLGLPYTAMVIPVVPRHRRTPLGLPQFSALDGLVGLSLDLHVLT